MKAEIKHGSLLVRIPLEKPHHSSTGKTLLIASTHGVQPTGARFRGKTVSIVANAFIYADPGSAQKVRYQKLLDIEEDGD